MNKNTSLYLCLLMAFFVAPAVASETGAQTAQKYQNIYSDSHFPFLWSRHQRLRLNNQARRLKPQMMRFKLSRLNKSLPVALMLQRDRSGKIKRARFAVVTMGFFTNHTRGFFFMKKLYKKGYHVLTIPTGLSKEYIAARPKFIPGDLEQEALTVLEMIQKTQKRIGLSNIINTSYIGSSYGAIVGVVVTALDSEGARLIDGSSNLFAPVLNPHYAFQRFEQFAQEKPQAFSKSTLSSLSKKFSLYRSLQNAKNPTLFPEELKSHSKWLIGDYTRKKLLKKIKKINLAYSLPSLKASPRRYHKNVLRRHSKRNILVSRKSGKELKDLSMVELVKETLPKHIQEYMLTEKGNFLYWYARIQNSGRNMNALRVVTTTDDPLNSKEEFQRLAQNKNTLVLSGGGHEGFYATSWFDSYVQRVF